MTCSFLRSWHILLTPTGPMVVLRPLHPRVVGLLLPKHHTQGTTRWRQVVSRSLPRDLSGPLSSSLCAWVGHPQELGRPVGIGKLLC